MTDWILAFLCAALVVGVTVWVIYTALPVMLFFLR